MTECGIEVYVVSVNACVCKEKPIAYGGVRAPCCDSTEQLSVMGYVWEVGWLSSEIHAGGALRTHTMYRTMCA